MHREKRKKTVSGFLKLSLILLGFCLLLAVCFLIRTRGSLAVRPERELESPGIVFFSQKDETWASDRLGESSFTLESSGCLVTCVASALQMQGLLLKDAEPLNPQTLNRAFSEAGAYDAQGNLQWGVLESAFSLHTDREGPLESDRLEAYLEKGIYPIVRVRVKGFLGFHYVLITGTENGGYVCMDPLETDASPVPLSRYGNRIYAVRCVY